MRDASHVRRKEKKDHPPEIIHGDASRGYPRWDKFFIVKSNAEGQNFARVTSVTPKKIPNRDTDVESPKREEISKRSLAATDL